MHGIIITLKALSNKNTRSNSKIKTKAHVTTVERKNLLKMKNLPELTNTHPSFYSIKKERNKVSSNHLEFI